MAERLLCREIGLLAALFLTLSEEKIMLKRYLSLVMVGLLFHAVGAGPASASPQADKQSETVAELPSRSEAGILRRADIEAAKGGSMRSSIAHTKRLTSFPAK